MNVTPVDRVILGGERSLLWPILGAMVGAILVKSLIRYGYLMLFERISQATIRACREELFAKLQRMDFGYFDRTTTGDLMAYMTGDIDAVRHMIAWVIYQTSENARVWAKYIPAIEFTSGLLPVILILVGGWMIIRGDLSLGQLVTFNGLVWAIAQPLRMAGWLVNDASALLSRGRPAGQALLPEERRRGGGAHAGP